MSDQLSFDFNVPSTAQTALWTPDDIFDAASPKVVTLFLEDKRVERKSASIRPKVLAEYFSAFANTQPDGGVIFVGVEDDGSISGCSSLTQKQINELETEATNFCPDARVEFKQVPAQKSDGSRDFIIAVRVQYRRDRLVETARGDAFHRVGDTKRKLLEAQKREVRISKGEIDYELEAIDLSYPSDFDTELITQFCSSFKRHRGISSTRENTDILILNNLGDEKRGRFFPNLACVLLFAKNPSRIIPGCLVRFLRFDGTVEGTGTNFNAVKDLFIEGNIPTILAAIDRAVESQMRDFTRLGNDGKFYTRPEYPKDAWYEAVVNACVHRSYNQKNVPIFVKMFDDRFVVESPGGFPPLVTPENIYDTHNPRNPHLMHALYYLDFVKCAHEGTRRMREMMAEAELPPPEFSQEEVNNILVRVTLRNNVTARKAFVDADAAKHIGQSIINSLTESERLVVNYLAERGKINVSDAQRLLGREWSTAKKTLMTLKSRGILEYHHRGDIERDPKAHFTLRQR